MMSERACGPVVIVLASGRGERFFASGGRVHKLQARLGERTVLEHTLAAVRDSGLAFHIEDAGHPGMGDTIAAAVRATADSPAWLILPGDLPLVRPETLRKLAALPMAVAVARPRYRGRLGHPVRFTAICKKSLLELRGDTGAFEVARMHGVAEIPVDDEGCVFDIDTVQDLTHASNQWR